MAAPTSIVHVSSFKTRGASTELCAVVQRYGLSINRKTSSVFINVCPLSTTKKCHAVSLCAYPLVYTVVSSIRWVNSCMSSPLAGTKLCDCAIYLVLTTFHEEPTSFKSLPPPHFPELRPLLSCRGSVVEYPDWPTITPLVGLHIKLSW